jgi:hypothetical protein
VRETVQLMRAAVDALCRREHREDTPDGPGQLRNLPQALHGPGLSRGLEAVGRQRRGGAASHKAAREHAHAVRGEADVQVITRHAQRRGDAWMDAQEERGMSARGEERALQGVLASVSTMYI